MKTNMNRIVAIACVLVVLCSVLAGCKGAGSAVQYEVPSYQGQLAEGQTKSDYNKELFYRNYHKIPESPDPFVLDNTAIDGWYYLYGTIASILTYRSRDLMEWEPVGNALDNMDYAAAGKLSEVRRTTWKDLWAPEVVYDPDEQLYYMFFSATPQEEAFPVGKGVRQGTPKYMMIVAVSKYPDREFQIVNFRDPDSCGEENLHSYNEQVGVSDGKGGYLDAHPHYYAKYSYFDPSKYKEFLLSIGNYDGDSYAGYEDGLDPHPYIDSNGDKYLFWVTGTDSSRICAVKMVNWLQPDWSTATHITQHSFYTIADYKASQNGETVEHVPYELMIHNRINEGPQLLEHNGKFYLTYSVNSYEDSSYLVAQAVSDNILGPYRKLTEEEGGVVISGSTAGSQEITGTGHHDFVTAGDQLLMVYHRHNDTVLGGGPRNPAVDEMRWITIKDKFGNDLDVLYTNGPTCTVQPRIESFAEYVNIAPQATVSGSKDASYLTDGLLSIYKYANPDFIQYVQETSVTKTTTFTFDFDEARPVRAVMVYNSKMETTAFNQVARVEFVCEENGKEVVRFIKNIQFGQENFQSNDFDGSIYYIISGAAAYAEFDELNVKSVRITMEVPEGQESIGISEVRILGK